MFSKLKNIIEYNTPIRTIIISKATINGFTEKMTTELVDIKTFISNTIHTFDDNKHLLYEFSVSFIAVYLCYYYIQKLHIKDIKLNKITLYSNTKRMINVITIMYIMILSSNVDNAI